MSDEFSDLLRSPVPTGRRSSRPPRVAGSASGGRWPFLAGMVLGIVAVVLGYLVARPGDDVDLDAATTTTTVTTPAVGFPEGYVPVTDLVAIHPTAATATSDHVLIAFTTAAFRGLDPDRSTPFQGGDFELEYADGTTVGAEEITFDVRAPEAFTVVFPLPANAAPQVRGITLTSLWSRRTMVAGIPLAVEGVPHIAQAPVDIEFDDGSGLRIDGLTFDSTGGGGSWSVTSGAAGASRVYVGLTVGAGWAWFTDASRTFFGLGETVPSSSAASGTLEFTTPDGEPPDLSAVTEVWIDVEVDFIDAAPTTVIIDVSSLPLTGF